MAWQGARGLPADWRRRRQLVLERDDFTCQVCRRCWPDNQRRAPGDRRGILEVDHVGDRADHRLENLRTLCYRCHGTRTARQGNAVPRVDRSRRPLEDHPGVVK